MSRVKERFYSFNNYLRGIFGTRVHRISLDAGLGCPNIDGTLSDEGCIYCNNKGFAAYARTSKTLEEQIESSMRFYSQHLGAKKFIAYFQAFTNTYAQTPHLKKVYDTVKKFDEIVGVFISTRPDCVDEDKIKLIAEYKKNYLVWIEYGLQTTHDHILNSINRNHTYKDFLAAVELTKRYEIQVGVHLIVGLPSATYQDMMDDALRIAKCGIQGVKFHVLHVLKDTQLEKVYRSGRLRLLTRAEYIKVLCDYLERLPSRCVVLRLISTAFGEYLVAPLWINQKSKIIEEISQELEKRGTHQGYYCSYEGARCQGQ
ncbi:MAG: TIGR01212 family radical SAM protein [Candidatus Omnitrophota bacterium]|nr:MAG: TIGR01212 family radical SAM protein [Candidatus Omnitrophota bacterium]